MAVNIELGRRAQSLAGTAASGIEGPGQAETQKSTAEALKQRRKCEKAAALDIEKFTVEVAGIFKSDLKRVMKTHDIDNQ